MCGVGVWNEIWPTTTHQNSLCDHLDQIIAHPGLNHWRFCFLFFSHFVFLFGFFHYCGHFSGSFDYIYHGRRLNSLFQSILGKEILLNHSYQSSSSMNFKCMTEDGIYINLFTFFFSFLIWEACNRVPVYQKERNEHVLIGIGIVSLCITEMLVNCYGKVLV